MPSDKLVKEVLFKLMKGGREASLSRIASDLGVEYSTIIYIHRKLADDGILRGVEVYVNPNYLGYYRAYLTVEGGIKDFMYTLIFNCVEGVDVYEVVDRNFDSIRNVDKIASDRGAKVHMKLVPPQSLRKLGRLDLELVRVLALNPHITLKRASEILKVPYLTVVRRFNRLVGKGIIKFIPLIDLKKAGIVLLSLYTARVEALKKNRVLSYRLLWDFSNGEEGVITLYSYDLEDARYLVEVARRYDPNLVPMVKYGYSVVGVKSLL